MRWEWWADLSPRGPHGAVALLMREDPEAGVEVVAVERNGREVELTWHGGQRLAEAWAASTYGDAVGSWDRIPADVTDPIRYVLRSRR